MCSLKTITVLVVLLAWVPKGANAFDDMLDTFAECAGRYSAQLEHQWLMNDPASTRTEAQRAQVLDVLFALMDGEADAALTLKRRLEAKFAHSRLLQRATFNSDLDSALWARGRSNAEMRRCASLVLAEPEVAEPGFDHAILAEPTPTAGRANLVPGADVHENLANH